MKKVAINNFWLPSVKLICSILPAPPVPCIKSILLMNWGKSFGSNLFESMMKALNMRRGAIALLNSCVVLMTPMIDL